ncbi:hypothetical protein PENTCL1PPCAC_28282, partial [Pristionchus entomophagus]
LSLSSSRLCCARFSFSNTSRNPSFRSTVERHRQNSTGMVTVFPRSTEPNSTLLTFVLVLICLMLALIIIFTVVHCAIFCSLTIGKIKKSMRSSSVSGEGKLPYFVLTDYSETSP